MLAEAKALVNTLPGWTVSESIIVPVQYSTKKQMVFGTGKVEELMQLTAQASKSFNSIMLNIDMLTGGQHSELFQLLRIPIYDR